MLFSRGDFRTQVKVSARIGHNELNREALTPQAAFKAVNSQKCKRVSEEIDHYPFS
jgi:hypothetical protein